MAAFAGIIVALSAAFIATLAPSFGSDTKSEPGLALELRWALFVVFLAGLVCLVTAIWYAVFRVIKPEDEGQSNAIASEFPPDELLVVHDTTPTDVGVGDRWRKISNVTREQNELSAKALKRGYSALFFGLCVVSIEAVVVALYAIDMLPK